MPVRPLLLALGTVLCVTVAVLHGQTQSQTSQSGAASRLDTLPPALREQGQAILSQRDDRQRAELVAALARNSPDAAREFLLAVLASDPSPEVRSAIVNRLGRNSSRAVRGRAIVSIGSCQVVVIRGGHLEEWKSSASG